MQAIWRGRKEPAFFRKKVLPWLILLVLSIRYRLGDFHLIGFDGLLMLWLAWLWFLGPWFADWHQLLERIANASEQIAATTAAAFPPVSSTGGSGSGTATYLVANPEEHR